MYYPDKTYPCPYYVNPHMYHPCYLYHCLTAWPYRSSIQMPGAGGQQQYPHQSMPSATQTNHNIRLKDYGPEPFVVNIEEASKQNDNFRLALWTGEHLQLTLMSINVGEDIGLEIHPDLDQFIRIEQGQGIVRMGDRRDRLDFQRTVSDGYVFVIPAGKWHNLINTGNVPIKLYSIYAPPQHPRGTVHETKADAEAAE